jgi:hypothetical protein
MPSRKGFAPEQDWLGKRQARGRVRPWAFEEQLLRGQGTKAEPGTALPSLAEQLEELARSVAEMEEKLQAAWGDDVHPRRLEPRPAPPVRRASPRRSDGKDGDYWLAHCEGFAVDASGEALGVVGSVRFQSRLDRPDELEIGLGRIRPRAILVPVDEVEEIDPERRQITLRSDPRRLAQGKGRRPLLGRARRKLFAPSPSTFR